MRHAARSSEPGRTRTLALLAGVALAFASTTAGAQLGGTEIRVLGLAVDVDTRPDLDGVQNTMTAVRDIPTGVETFLGSAIDPAARADLPGTLVRAELTGPSTGGVPIPLAAPPNQLLELPLLRVAGAHLLTGVRLESAEGELLLERDPGRDPIVVDVIDQLLVTSVTSRALTLEEIEERGIVIDASNFTALEFAVALTLGSEQVVIDLPVLIPTTGQALASSETPRMITLSPDPEQLRRINIPNFSLSGFGLRPPPELDEKDQQLIPPIHGVIVIPGNLAFLNQFFSVILQATNTAPAGSGLTVQATRATISLPLGGDGIADTGDDPLRVAETGSGVHTELPLLAADGSDAIAPQATNAAEFLVEGLREGTHRVDFDLSGQLYVPALGRLVELTGLAAGVVQVRNPTFSVVLAHPRAVRTGEAYRLFATVTNTSATPANLFQLELARRSLSGASFADGETGLRTLEHLPAGGSATFGFDLVARTTGEVTGTVFLADEGVNGSFVLTTGVGDRGIPLSPDTLVLPQTVEFLPDEPDLVAAAVRVLGMAYSVATAPAGTLPPDVARVSRAHVFERAVKLAQVGLHVRLGEDEHAALVDLLLDWYGNDRARLSELHPDPADLAVAERDLRAFDALRRSTDAGHDLDELAGVLLRSSLADAGLAGLQRELAARFASRPGMLSLGVSATGAPLAAELRNARGARLGTLEPGAALGREIPFASRLPLRTGSDGSEELLLVAAPDPEPYTLVLSAQTGASDLDLTLVVRDAAGAGRLVIFPRAELTQDGNARLQVTPGAAAPPLLEIDADGDGSFEGLREPLAVEPITDAPPQLLGVHQWAKGAEPATRPSFEQGDPIGRMVAVLFDEEVERASAEWSGSYALSDNTVGNVSLQPDRRVAFVVLANPVGPFVPRALTVHSVRDLRGQAMETDAQAIVPDPERGPGGRFRGRVVTASGEPIPFATVKYIQPLFQAALLECFPKDFVLSTFRSDHEGRFAIDYVLQNALQDVCTPDVWLNARSAGGTNHFKLEAEDPQTGEQGRLSTRVQFDGQELALDVIVRGYGAIEGRLLDELGNTVVGGDPGTAASLQVYASNLSTGERLVSWVDAAGHYAFPRRFAGIGASSVTAPSVPVGNVALLVVRPQDGATAVATVNVPAGGTRVEQDLTLFPPYRFGSLHGVVLEADGRTPAPYVTVQLAGRVLTGLGLAGRTESTGLIGSAETDGAGAFRFDHVPAGAVQVVAQRAASFEEAEARELVPEGGDARVQIVLPGAGGTVRGLVLDGFGSPVGGAQVAGGTTLTNAGADGRFEIRGLPRGTVTVYAQGNGSLALGTVTVTTTGPDDLQEVVVVLEPVGSISGTVFEADGETPIAAQKVQLWVEDKGVRAETFTDPDGRFHFRHQSLGEYNLRAIRRSDSDGGMAFTEIRFAGDERDADLVFRGQGEISGRVIQSNGIPVVADVLVTRKVWRIVTDSGPVDNAALGLAILEQYAQIDGLESSVERAIRENNLDAPANEFFLLMDETAALRSDVLGPGGEVTGRFRFAGDATGGPFTVAALGPFLTPSEARGEIPRSFDPADRLVDVGDIVLEPATASVRGTVYLPDGETPVGADVAVRIRSLDNSGSVMTAEGSQTQPVLPEYEVQTDENGRYAFPIVLRGRFVLTADTGVPAAEIRADTPAEMETERFEDDERNRLLNVRLRGRTSGSVPLLPFGEFLTADIRLHDVAGARVRVVDADGVTPVEGARVALTTASDLDEDLPAAFTDAAGDVDFFPLPEGSVTVAATLVDSPQRGTATAVVPVNPPNGLELAVTVQLGAATSASGEIAESDVFGTVEGTVLRADGTPLANPAQVVVTSKGVGSHGTSGPDGRYRIENVPGGPFLVDVFEPNTARRGRASGSLVSNGQTVDVPVTLVGLGRVAGSVLSNDGGRALPGVDVELLPSGNFSDRLVTRSDPQGSYLLPGVPLGVYTVRARDFQSGLTGEASGTLRRDGELATTDVRLQASGGIAGRVYAAGVGLDAQGQPVDAGGASWPDAPVAAGVSVEIRRAGRGVETVQTGADGSFVSSGFLPVGHYELVAREPLVDDGATARAHVRFDGEIAFVVLALRGRGVVDGVLLDSLGTAPVAGASVTLSSESPFLAGPRTRITDADGRFAFDGVPVGVFSLGVRTNLEVPPLGGAAGGTLVAHAQQITFADGDDDPLHEAIRLQSAGTLFGRVLLEDGSTPADGAVALLEGAGLRLSRVTGADGELRIEGVPLGTYTVSIREPIRNGVASRAVTLVTNGEEWALGDIVLDASGPRVVASEPVAFAADVSPSAAIVVRFDEPIAPASLTAQSFTVDVAGAPVTGTRELREGGTAIAFVPSAPLPDLQNVSVRVRADRIGFAGEVLEAGVRDLAGLSLGTDFVLSFTTGDSQPPELVSMSPADGAVEVDVRAVVRVEFSEPVDPASVAGFTLTRSNGASTPGRVNTLPILGGRVLVFTPDVALALDEHYVAVLTGPVRDPAGNAMAETELRTSFATLDTRAPELAELALAPGSLTVTGRTVVLSAGLVQDEPGAGVEFSLGGVLLGTVTGAPYTLPLFLAPSLGNAITVRAVASDAAGNRGPPRNLPLAIAPNQPPVVTLLQPASGAVSQGDVVTVEVQARDDVGLAELRFVAGDGVVASGTRTVVGESATMLFQFTVPERAPVGSTIDVRAAARDTLGAVAQSDSVSLTVGDELPPVVTIGSPPAGATFSPGSTVTVLLRGDDASGIVELGLAVSPFGFDETRAFAPAQTTAQASFTLSVPADAAAGTVNLVARARDAAGNDATRIGTLRIADTRAPSVRLASPDGSLQAEAGATVEIDVAADDDVGIVRIELLPDGQAAQIRTIPATRAARERFFVAVPASLPLGATLAISASAFDAAGNAGSAAALTLTVADLSAPALTIAEPLEQALVPPGESFPVRVRANDRSGVALLALAASGAASASEERLFDPPAPDVDELFFVAVPADAPAGAILSLAVVADDPAGRRASATRTVRVADLEPPNVATVDPADSATDVAPGAVVRLGFDEPVLRASASAETISLTCDGSGQTLGFAFASGDALLVLTPAAPLPAGTLCSLAVTTGVRDVAGNPLAAGFTASFRVRAADTTAPEVVSIEPADGAVGVPLGAVVRIGISEAIVPASVTAESVALERIAGGTLAASRTLEAGGTQIVLTPAAPLGPSTAYRVRIGTGITDLAGNPLPAPVTSGFTSEGPDLVGPRLVELLPADGATGVSVRPLVRTCFDEGLAAESFGTGESAVLRVLDPSAGGAVRAGTLAASEDGRCVLLTLDEPLAFEHAYTAELLGTLRGADGNAVVEGTGAGFTSLGHGFETGRFAITRPAAGVPVVERTELTLEASGSAALGIAEVVFSVNGVASEPLSSAPFRRTIAVPDASEVSELVLTAVAFDASGTELARDEVRVPVVLSLRFEHPISGVPLGATGVLRLVASSPPLADVPLELSVHDAAIVGVPAALVFPAGASAFEIAASGLAEGATAVVARSSQGVATTIAAVSESLPIAPQTPVLAAPTGMTVRTFASLGEVILPAGSTRSVPLRLLETPATSRLDVTVTSRDPAIATLGAAVTIAAGETSAQVPLVAGVPGETLLTLRVGGEGRELRVVVGEPPPAARTTPIVAPPVGTLVISYPSVGDVIVAPGATRSVTLRLFTEPVAEATTLVFASSDPAVAMVTQTVIVPAGSTDATLPIEAGAPGDALLFMRPADDLRTGWELRVVVGTPAPERTPPIVAPPVGTLVISYPSAGDVIVAPGATRSVTLRLFTEPVAEATTLVFASSDPAVAMVTQTVIVPAGSTDATLPIDAGAPGDALLFMRPADDLRTGWELRVVVGTPAPERTPPIVARPIGVVALEAGTLAELSVAPGATRSVTLDLLAYPSLADLPVRATSRAPDVVTVTPALQSLPTGARAISWTLTVLGGDGDEAIVDIEYGLERRTLRVVVGVPAPERRPPTLGPPVGVEVLGP